MGNIFIPLFINQDRKYIHRIIMNAPKGMVVDHINHNTLDNRKSNLRVVTNSENLRNSYNAATDSQKLSQKQVEEILLSNESNKKLAAKFNVSNALISNVRTGICYANYCPNIIRVKNKWFTKQSSLVNKYMGYKQCKNKYWHDYILFNPKVSIKWLRKGHRFIDAESGKECGVFKNAHALVYFL